jgi:cbb3-type cytochrome oxidase maturation protein
MEVLVFLVPLALMLGLLGLMGFLWSLRNGQYDDLEGAGWRAIADDDVVPEKPVPWASVAAVRPDIKSNRREQDQRQNAGDNLRVPDAPRRASPDGDAGQQHLEREFLHRGRTLS